MIGAYHRMLSQGAPRPMVVVMVGTAVTVEAVDAQGKFLGGLILPGHGIMLRAMESGTAGLHVPTGEVRLFPTNTSDAQPAAERSWSAERRRDTQSQRADRRTRDRPRPRR